MISEIFSAQVKGGMFSERSGPAEVLRLMWSRAAATGDRSRSDGMLGPLTSNAGAATFRSRPVGAASAVSQFLITPVPMMSLAVWRVESYNSAHESQVRFILYANTRRNPG